MGYIPADLWKAVVAAVYSIPELNVGYDVLMMFSYHEAPVQVVVAALL